VRLKELVEDGIDVFALGGDIDFHFGPVLRDMLQAKLKSRCPALVLDLHQVDFIDSRGIAAIIEYYRDSAEYSGLVGLAALSPEVKPIIETVRLETIMPVFATVTEAVTAMKNMIETRQPA
jgi:anti-sigma B factor antagonist